MRSVGRTPISQKELDLIFHKLEPYLKNGLSLNKACIQAKIPKSTVYQIYQKNVEFMEKIDACRNYHAVLATSVLTTELERISTKQKNGDKLGSDEIKFVQWIALNNNSLKEEYGRIEESNEHKKPNEEMQMFIDDPNALKTLLGTFEEAMKPLNSSN